MISGEMKFIKLKRGSVHYCVSAGPEPGNKTEVAEVSLDLMFHIWSLFVDIFQLLRASPGMVRLSGSDLTLQDL